MFKLSPLSFWSPKDNSDIIQIQDPSPEIEIIPLDPPSEPTPKGPLWDLSEEETLQFVQDELQELIERHLEGLTGGLPRAEDIGTVSPED